MRTNSHGVWGKKPRSYVSNHVVIYNPWRRLNENHPLQFTFLLDDEPACALVCSMMSPLARLFVVARFVLNFSLFAQNCARRSRTRKTETERETEERDVCDRKRRRNGFRNGNIGCSIFRLISWTYRKSTLRMNRRIWCGSFWERKRRSSVSSRCR
jgi:hypothetical protein